MAYFLSSFDCGPWVLASGGSDRGTEDAGTVKTGDTLGVRCVGVLCALTPRILMALVVWSFPHAALNMYPLPPVFLETEEVEVTDRLLCL